MVAEGREPEVRRGRDSGPISHTPKPDFTRKCDEVWVWELRGDGEMGVFTHKSFELGTTILYEYVWYVTVNYYPVKTS